LKNFELKFFLVVIGRGYLLLKSTTIILDDIRDQVIFLNIIDRVYFVVSFLNNIYWKTPSLTLVESFLSHH